MNSSAFQRIAEKKESTKRWLAQHLAVDVERDNWVLDPRGIIKKASLTFVAKFF